MTSVINSEFLISAVYVPILVAVIGGPLMIVLKKIRDLDNNNTNQHSNSMSTLTSIQSDITSVKSDINAVKTTVNGVQLDVHSLHLDVSDLKQDMKDVRVDVKTVETKLNNHIKKTPTKSPKVGLR